MNNVSDPAFIAGICAIIAALTTATVKILNAIRENSAQIVATNTKVDTVNDKVDTAATKVIENDKKTDAIAIKAEEIHQMANGNLSKLQAKVEEKDQQILALERELRAKVESLNDVLFDKLKVDRRVVRRK